MSVSMAYALTRMQARVAERPAQEALKRLLAVGDFGHFLQLGVRAGFGRWLARLGPASTSHQVELSLRLRFRELLDELARWLPVRWGSSINLLKLSPELPALDRLLRGEAAYPWMHHDPLLARLMDEAGRLDRAAVTRMLPLLVDVEAGMLGRHWLGQTQCALPAPGDRAAGLLRALLQGLVEPDAHQASSRQLELAFRRQPDATVRVVAFTALLREDLEFLRGQLTRRRLLQDGGY